MSALPLERWVARAQLWLGTLVEVALPARDACEVRFAAAFAAVAHVHRTMSAHDSRSDVARIARLAHRRAVAVDPGTYAVLEQALRLWKETRGAFDVAVAPVLARAGLLPARSASPEAWHGRMHAVALLPHHRVRTTRPVALDLSGIAKGYAVDRAVVALRQAGASRGIVNAGGDLRVFGAYVWVPIRVRRPDVPAQAVHLFDLHDAAAATSADYFRGPRGGLVDPRTRALRAIDGSITVTAPTCALADALAKIVALDPQRAPAMLARHGAYAFRIGTVGHERDVLTTCRAPTAHVRPATVPTANECPSNVPMVHESRSAAQAA